MGDEREGVARTAPRYERIIAHCTPDFMDERGTITNIIDGVALQHAAIITSREGSVRGNHYHPTQGQYIYIITGELTSYSQQVEHPQPRPHITRAGVGDLLYCPPMVAHAYRFVKATIFLNLDTGIRNSTTYPEDTVYFPIIS